MPNDKEKLQNKKTAAKLKKNILKTPKAFTKNSGKEYSYLESRYNLGGDASSYRNSGISRPGGLQSQKKSYYDSPSGLKTADKEAKQTYKITKTLRKKLTKASALIAAGKMDKADKVAKKAISKARSKNETTPAGTYILKPRSKEIGTLGRAYKTAKYGHGLASAKNASKGFSNFATPKPSTNLIMKSKK